MAKAEEDARKGQAARSIDAVLGKYGDNVGEAIGEGEQGGWPWQG
jgi:hypothetical protein